MLSVLARNLALGSAARSFASTLRMTVCGHDNAPGKIIMPKSAGYFFFGIAGGGSGPSSKTSSSRMAGEWP
jgi:hypothetical protein